MFRLLLITTIMLAAGISFSAKAAFNTESPFIMTDWKTAGDKQSVLDTSTGIEWLKLTQTFGMSMLDVQEELNGGAFEGWRLPSESEVATMFMNWWGPGVDIYNYSRSTVVRSNTTHGRRNIDFNIAFGTGGRNANRTYGVYYDTMGDLRGAAGVYVNVNSYFYGLNGGIYSDELRGVHGIYLVSDGGTTLSSINDPLLNVNNPNAPINNVTTPWGSMFILLPMAAFGFRRLKQ